MWSQSEINNKVLTLLQVSDNVVESILELCSENLITSAPLLDRTYVEAVRKEGIKANEIWLKRWIGLQIQMANAAESGSL